MQVIADRTAGIDPDMMQGQSPSGISPGDDMAQGDPGEFRVRVPRKRGDRAEAMIAGDCVMPG
jgi:hypothetical protein